MWFWMVFIYRCAGGLHMCVCVCMFMLPFSQCTFACFSRRKPWNHYGINFPPTSLVPPTSPPSFKSPYLPHLLTTTPQPSQWYNCWCYFESLLFSLCEISLFHYLICTNMPNVAHYYLNTQVFWTTGTRICFKFQFNVEWLIIIK